MAHVRKEARLHFIRAAQLLRFFVDFRIQRQHAAIGVLELGVQAREIFLPLAQFVQNAQQLAVFVAQLFHGVMAGRLGDFHREARQPVRRARRMRTETLSEYDGRASGMGLDAEIVHQTLRAD